LKRISPGISTHDVDSVAVTAAGAPSGHEVRSVKLTPKGPGLDI
jgi:hypothetical protein